MKKTFPPHAPKTAPGLKAIPPKPFVYPPHDGRGHTGSTRGRKDMTGRKHKGSGG